MEKWERRAIITARLTRTWKRLCDKVALELDDFFEKLHSHSKNENTTDVNQNSIDLSDIESIEKLLGVKLAYREEQHNYALEVMEAIKKQAMLLIQGGVGVGKSYGYLLPIFFTYKNDKRFKKIIISTSSIALQEQLIKDIDNVSKMLGIEIKVGVAKGINNFACLSKIYDLKYNPNTSEETKELLTNLLNDMRTKKTGDKAELIKLSKDIWEQIKVCNRGFCSNCDYCKICPYQHRQEELNDCNIVVTNHANYVRNIIDETELVELADMVVIDEVHDLVAIIQSVIERELRLDSIVDLIEEINEMLGCYGVRGLIKAVHGVFSRARASGSANFFNMNEKRGTKGKYSVIETNRLKFEITKTVTGWLDIAIEELEKLEKEMIKYNRWLTSEFETIKNQDKIKIISKKQDLLKKRLVSLREVLVIFKDMRKNNESDNIYWASFYDNNKITIRYIPKNILDILNKMFSDEIPVVLTSGTMGAYANYRPIVNGLHLNEIDRLTGIIYGEEQFSPYCYDQQALFYYDTEISEPNDSDEYIKELALKIDRAIRISNGKALILFTSKKTMYRVYQLLSTTREYPFDLLLHMDNNITEVKEQFANDINSCLFATGAFWEGIDIKGPALSNLIITHLPFEQVDAVNQYEASKYTSKYDQMQQVYLPKMIVKFTQAFGRLIRSFEDRGLVFCFDPRISKYLDEISKATQISRCEFKTNMLSVELFYNMLIETRIQGYSKEQLDKLWLQYNEIEYLVPNEGRDNSNDNAKVKH